MTEDKPLLLIVDDEPDLVESYESYFARRGFTIDTANSGTSALAKAVKTRPHVILSDLNMRDGSGLDLLSALHQGNMRPNYFIILTGDDSMSVGTKPENTPDLLLNKPIAPSAILKAIQDLFASQKG